MTKAKTLWLLATLFCVAFWPAQVSAQGKGWEALNATGVEAYQRGDYTDAEKQWDAALKAAEEFGSEDPRLATSLSNLAGLYYAQSRYAEAEPLLKRSLAIDEKAFGPEHPNVAQSLENYADLLQKMGRGNEATDLETRAKAIRAKHAKQNPAK